jgi:Trk K+ transport system NAD-binding subunit
MKIGVIRPESPYVGQTIDARFFGVLPEDAEIILVLRRKRVLGPRPGLKLEAGDELVAVTTQTAWEHLLEVLDAIPQPAHSD